MSLHAKYYREPDDLVADPNEIRRQNKILRDTLRRLVVAVGVAGNVPQELLAQAQSVLRDTGAV